MIMGEKTMTYLQLIVQSLKYIKDENIKEIPEAILKDYCSGFDINNLNEEEWKEEVKSGLSYLVLLNMRRKNMEESEEDKLKVDIEIDLMKDLESELFLENDTPLENIINYALITIPILFLSDYDQKYLTEETRIKKGKYRNHLLNYIYDALCDFRYHFPNKLFQNPRYVYSMNESEEHFYSNDEEDDLIDSIMKQEENGDFEDDYGEEDRELYDPNGLYCFNEDNELLYFPYDKIWSSVYNEGAYLYYLMKKLYLIKLMEEDEEALQRLMSLDGQIDYMNQKTSKERSNSPHKSLATELYQLEDTVVKDYEEEAFQQSETDELASFFLKDKEKLEDFTLDELAFIILNYHPTDGYTKEDFILHIESFKKIMNMNIPLAKKAQKIKSLSIIKSKKKE